MDYRDRQRRATVEAAAEWVLRLQEQKLTRSERVEYVRWLRESPLHVAEMLRASHVHGELADFPHWNEIAPVDVSSPEIAVIQLSETHDLSIADTRPGRSSWSWRRISALAAGLAVLGIALVYFANFRPRVIDTAAGESLTVTLADGSVVRVSPDTNLRVYFTRHERRVSLSRGDALFRVAKDPEKPFLVETNRTRVRAVGTAFAVERHYDSVIVTVEEGRVAVAQAPPQPSASPASTATEFSLGPDQQIVMPATGSMGHVRKVDSHRELAWADGRLIFDHDPVAEVVKRFNRFNRIQIKVLDPELAARPVSAVFNVSDPEAFVSFLESVANIRVTRPSRNMIVIASGGT
ncbi:MAG TPA: FecR domain-containing protein [Steroidobacteraceae bacterium]